jgi:sigma-B regulation protein RsbQ
MNDQLEVRRRNNVRVIGDGPATLVMAHGFGCDQNMWRFLAGEFSGSYRVVLFDHVGAGASDLSAYDPVKYDTLGGYAADLVEIARLFAVGPTVLLGHSVSCMIGMIADIAEPALFCGHVMVGPSPCYVNDGDYIGGFSRDDIDSLLATLESNYLGWSSTMAPVIMGAPGQPELGAELTNSFCRTDPEIAKQFARVTFLSDERALLGQFDKPTLILQCSDDLIAPVAVGEYLHRAIARSVLTVIDNVGHCPHLSEPESCIVAIRSFLKTL